MRYDQIALGVSIIPFIFVPFFFLPVLATWPFIIYLTWRHWGQVGDDLPRSRWGFVVAHIVSAMEVLLLLVFFVFVVGG
jgi:hypothetical protein